MEYDAIAAQYPRSLILSVATILDLSLKGSSPQVHNPVLTTEHLLHQCYRLHKFIDFQ